MKNLIVYGSNPLENVSLITTLQHIFRLQYYSIKEIMLKEYHLNTALGKQSQVLIEDKTLPDETFINKLLESLFKRSNTNSQGLLFDNFPTTDKQFSLIESLHDHYQHTLFVVVLYETVEQIYNRLLVTSECENIDYQNRVRKKANYIHEIAENRLNYLVSFNKLLVLDDALPEDAKQNKIRDFFE